MANKSFDSVLPPATTVSNNSMDDPNKYISRDSDVSRTSFVKLNATTKSVTEDNTTVRATEVPVVPKQKGDIRMTYEFFIQKRTLSFVPVIIWSGFSMAIYAAIFVPIMTGVMKNTIP